MEGIMNWLPWTGIVLIDFILGFLYLVVGVLAAIAIIALTLCAIAILVMTIPVWVPIFAIVVLIMKICGL